MFHVQKQIRKLYASTILGSLSLAGAWTALLAARGYSLVEIGLAETVFHAASLLFELPSGILADVFGRKRLLLAGSVFCLLSNLLMLFSQNLPMICLAMALTAFSYNCASGSGDALAYDSLKGSGDEAYYERYASNELLFYRIGSGLSTLCAGLALFVGYRCAYAVDAGISLLQLAVIATLYEPASPKKANVLTEFKRCLAESLAFLKQAKAAYGLMLANSLVGATDVLLLFFLQAKLTEKGLSAQGLGPALFFMQLGGVVGTRLILKLSGVSYHKLFAGTAALVLLGIGLEHGAWTLAVLGGFLSALADDALQVRTNRLLQEQFPSDQRATLLSVDSLLFSAVMIVLTPLASVLFTYW